VTSHRDKPEKLQLSANRTQFATAIIRLTTAIIGLVTASPPILFPKKPTPSGGGRSPNGAHTQATCLHLRPQIESSAAFNARLRPSIFFHITIRSQEACMCDLGNSLARSLLTETPKEEL